MKKILLVCFVSASVVCMSCKNKSSKEGQDSTKKDSVALTTISFESDMYDFGEVTEGEVVEHTFKFTNTGNNDLKIEEVQASCGCTTPDYTKEIVKPGEKGDIQVKFNSSHREGNQAKKVTVYANTDPEGTVLRFTAKVLPQNNSK